MIGGSGLETNLTNSQTLNEHDALSYLIELGPVYRVLSGPFLVSRTGDAG